MKMNNLLVVAALGLSVGSARAGWTISGNPTVMTPQGGTGSYTFTISGDASLNPGSYSLGPLKASPLTLPAVTVTGEALSTSSVTLIDVPYSYQVPHGPLVSGTIDGVAVTEFTATVDWSAESGLAPGSYDIAVSLGYTPTSVGASPAGSDYLGNIIILVPSPEPSQTLAGLMLLGCGGLIFAGRRLFKKQSA
jgi:hypothetical protein